MLLMCYSSTIPRVLGRTISVSLPTRSRGIVAKRASSPYEDNVWNPHWIKIKNPAYSQKQGACRLIQASRIMVSSGCCGSIAFDLDFGCVSRSGSCVGFAACLKGLLMTLFAQVI